MLHNAELPLILWDVDPYDWREPGPGAVTQRVLSHVRSGSIVLLHDIHGGTISAVSAILDGLHRRGYHLVTLLEMLGEHTVGNCFNHGTR